tara:strand:+ start:3312 stop:3791 length:480 start_codon:yes stop_codon:yes gene_type:complete
MRQSQYKQPNSDNCFVCGIDNHIGLKLSFYDNGIDEVWTHCNFPADYQGYPGIVHGGIISSVLDEVCSRTAMIGDSNRFMMTVKLNIKYRLPVPVENDLRVMGKIIQLSSSRLKADGYIYLDNGKICAEAFATLVNVPQSIIHSSEFKELGWRINDDRN